MSLQVWLPLIKNYDNYGLSNLKFTQSQSDYTVSASNGKIGSTCMYNSSHTIGGLISDTKINLGTRLSMCCWVKFSTLMSASSLGGAMGGQHRYPMSTGMGLTIKYVTANTGYLSCNTGNGGGNENNRTYNTYCGNTLLNANTWYHVCFTYDGSTIKFYLNGELDGTHSHTGQINVDDYVHVFTWSSNDNSYGQTIHPNYKLNGYMNDFRIYDHVLSTKEIKEISKGLVAHYKLKPTNITNYASGYPFTIYNNYGVGATLTQLNEQFMGYPIYRLTMTPTSGSLSSFQTELWSHGVYHGTWTFNANTKYCYWIYYRPVSHSDVEVGGVASNINGWTEIAPHHFGDGWYRVGQYRDGSVNSAKTDNIFTSFRRKAATVGVPITIDFCAPHLIIGTTDIIETYDGIVIDNNIELDVSGYGNNGTKSVTFAVASDSPRYGSCYIFPNSSYINCGRGAMVRDAITVSCWGYMSDWSDYTNRRMLSCTKNGGWNLEPYNEDANNGMCFAVGTGTSSCTYLTAVSDVLCKNLSSGWHMFTGTYDGQVGKLYIDGVHRGTSTALSTKTPIFYNAGNSLFIGAEAVANNTTPGGSYFNGKMSDVRIYGTAFSASDIAELYHNAASVAKDGTLFAYDFNEFNPNQKSSIDKNGIVSTMGFNDLAVPIYDMKLKALDDGSVWARIHYLDLTNDMTFFANASEVAKCINKNNRYSRMGDVDKLKSQQSLPSGYTELEYIKSSGTQYIDTGFKPNQDTRIVVTASLSTPHSIYGTNSSGTSFNMTGNDSGMYYYWDGQNNTTITNYYNQIHTFEQDKNICKVDGVLYYTYTYSTWQAPCTMFLFGRNSGSGLNDSGTAQIYSCQIYDNSKLIRNFVPCKNASSVIGMYDLVENKFYGNNGTGSFTASDFVSKYEFMLTYPKMSSTGYNRWTQTSSPNSSSVSGYIPISVSWPEACAGLRKHGSSCLYNCDTGDTWYAPIGQYYIWEGGIPAANKVSIGQSQTELWIRVDKSANANQFKIYDGAMVASNYIEI